MTRINVKAHLHYLVQEPTDLLLHIAVAHLPAQPIISEDFSVDLSQSLESCQVGELNNRLHRMYLAPGEFQLNYQAEVELNPELHDPAGVGETPYHNLPAEVLTYLNPSRYCESDKLYRFAFEEFGQLASGYERVQAICDWVYHKLSYEMGSTTTTTTACDVLLQRTGVCRDFAHVAITLCRAMGIPARYLSGYAVHLDPPDFHGFFEAYLQDRWFSFDATRLAPVAGFVRIGTGRDAADVAFATIIGNAVLLDKSVWVTDASGATSTPSLADASGSGVSTAVPSTRNHR